MWFCFHNFLSRADAFFFWKLPSWPFTSPRSLQLWARFAKLWSLGSWHLRRVMDRWKLIPGNLRGQRYTSPPTQRLLRCASCWQVHHVISINITYIIILYTVIILSMYRYLKLVEYIWWYMMGDVGCLLYGAGDPCNPRCSQSKAKALHKKSTFPKPSRPFKRLSRGSVPRLKRRLRMLRRLVLQLGWILTFYSCWSL